MCGGFRLRENMPASNINGSQKCMVEMYYDNRSILKVRWSLENLPFLS